MSVEYVLINIDKKETISFSHLLGTTKKELSGNSITSAITTWYIIKNSGDAIGFVPDCFDKGDNQWPFQNISWNEINDYKDVTEEIVNELISHGLFCDNGIEYIDEDDNSLYLRKLENVWVK